VNNGRHPSFAGDAAGHNAAVAEIHLFDSSSERRPLPAGTVLFEAGDPGGEMYAVVSGEIDIVIGGAVAETVGAGGILGELALVDESPRAGGAVARSDAVVVPVARERFMNLVQQHPTFALQVMSVMADRLRGVPAADPSASFT
jgi:CRP/FNR family cyclic AMP-dependent transcriptional regulator